MTQPIGVTAVTFALPLTAGATVPWRYLAASDHVGAFLNAAGEEIAPAQHGSHFAVTPEGDTAAATGVVALTAIPPAGAVSLRLARVTPPIQLWEATPGAEGVEAALDRLTLIAQEAAVANGTSALNDPTQVFEPLVLHVPADYPDTGAALGAVQGYRAYFNASIEIRHAAGYEIAAPVFFDGADFRGVRLTSANTATGTTTADGTGIIPVASTFPLDRDVFYFRNCVSPRFDFVLDCAGRGRNGIFAEGGLLTFRHRAGVINAGINGDGDALENDFDGDGDAVLTGIGIVAKGAALYCESLKVAGQSKGIVAQSCARTGIWATYGAVCSIPYAQLQMNGSDPGIAAEHGGIGVSRASIVMMDYSTFTGSVRGIRSARSWVSARLAVFDAVNGEAIRVFEGGRVFAARASFVGAGRASAIVDGVLTHYPILAAYGSSETRPQGGGEIIAESADFSGAKSEIAVALGAGSLIVIDDSTADEIDNRVARIGGQSSVAASRLNDGAGGPVMASAANTAAEFVLVSDSSLFQGNGVILDGDSRVAYGIRTKETGRADVRGAILDNFTTAALQVDNPETGSRIVASDSLVDGAAQYPVLVGEPLSRPAPYLLKGDGIADDTARLNDWLAGGGTIRPLLSHTYRVTGAVSIPDAALIDGELRLIYDGPDDLAWLTIGNNVVLDRLRMDVPTATGTTVAIGTGYRGSEIYLTGGGGGGTSAITIANTAGLDLDRFECAGGFQRPLVLGNNAAWSTGGRLGFAKIRDYTRGIGINYLDGFTLGGYDIGERNALASDAAGHNGILATGIRNCAFGPGRIEGAGEHLFRLGGDPAFGASYNNSFGDMVLDGPGRSFIKFNADVIAYDFRFGDINAVGRFMATPGGNRELLRLSHCRDLSFGRVSLVLGDGAAFSAQDAIAANDVDGVTVAHLHADGLGQSVVDCVSGQDTGEGLGNGDVRNVFVGGLTGTDANSKVIVRFAMATGFEASGIHIAGMDYSSDGPLVTASPTTVVDGPCSISGRLRKTDLTALPSTTNLPANVAVDLRIGEMPVVAFDGALVDGRSMTQPFANRAAVLAAYDALPPAIQRLEWVTPRGDTVAVVRKAGSTMIVDLPGWVPDGVATVDHFGENTTPGTTDMQTPLANLLASGMPNVLDTDTYLSSRVTLTSGDVLRGAGAGRTVIRRAATGNMVTGVNAAGVRVSGVTFDLNTDAIGGTVNGQGFSLSGSDHQYSDIEVLGVGGTGGGGTGMVVVASGAYPSAERIVLDNARFVGAASTQSAKLGYVFSDVKYSMISRVIVEGMTSGVGAAHELKNNAQWNALMMLLARNSLAAVYMGQETAGMNGADYNVVMGVLGDGVQTGAVIGEGIGNVILGLVHSTTGSPSTVNMRGVFISGGSSKNYVDAVSTHGAMQYSAYVSGDENYIGYAAHDTGTFLAGVTSGYKRNVFDIKHPGARSSILGSPVVDASGFTRGTSDGNVFYCHATGQYLGSMSGTYYRQITPASVAPTYNADDRFRFEHSTRAVMALATSNDTVRRAGWSHTFATNSARGGVYHDADPASDANDVMTFRVGNTDLVTLGRTLFAAITDVAKDLGSATRRWLNLYAKQIRPGSGGPIWTSGTGSPEGVLAAPIGSIYGREDGGAGTSLYVKESGSGNTGWVAK